MARLVASLAFLATLGLGAGCRSDRHRQEGPGAVRPTPLDAARISVLVPASVRDRAGWGSAIFEALRDNGLPLDRSTACAVVAIIGQESGFQADPAVPGLAGIVKARLDAYEGKLGPLGRPIFRRLLAGHAPDNPRPFEERLAKVRTERDVDVVFRDLLAYHEANHPVLYGAANLMGKLFDVDSLAELNPITTAGPMQVSVRFATDWAREHGRDPDRVRDALYTRARGVYYGTARLFGHPASYPDMLYRFADYNGGVYSSRNAALQAQVARLVGKTLVLDGDLLGYGKEGEVKDDDTQTMQALRLFRERYAAKQVSEHRLEEDVRQEKKPSFERTATYGAIKKSYATRFGGAPPRYAVLPQVEIESPKLKQKRSTAWFAQSVERRFQSCLASPP